MIDVVARVVLAVSLVVMFMAAYFGVTTRLDGMQNSLDIIVEECGNAGR